MHGQLGRDACEERRVALYKHLFFLSYLYAKANIWLWLHIMFGYFILIFSSSYGVTILDTIMTLGFGCFSKLARWFESGDTAGNDIRTRIGLSELILPHSRPGRTRRHGGDVPPPLCACLSPGDAAARVRVGTLRGVFFFFLFGQGRHCRRWASGRRSRSGLLSWLRGISSPWLIEKETPAFQFTL